MLAATKLKMSGSEKKMNKNTHDISSIKRVTRKFLEVLRRCYTGRLATTIFSATQRCNAGTML